MSLITEDGTGMVDAESYATVAFCDQYHSDRGNTAWAALSTAQKESNLRLATDYMLQVYRERWNGTRVTRTQALDWPRYLSPIKDAPGVYIAIPAYYPYNTVAVEVKRACAVLAFKIITTPDLAPDLDRPVTRESIGPISVDYAVGARQTVRFQAVDHILSPLLKDGGSGSMATIRRC